MENVERTDTDILERIIIGRVEPHIYAFTTQTVPNYLKVGDTYRPVEERLNEWRHKYPDLRFECQHSAKIDESTIFRDYQVHQFLMREKSRQRLRREDLPLGVYYSSEFFKDATKEDVGEAVEDINRSAHDKDLRYALYSPDRLPQEYKPVRGPELELRENQKTVVHNFKQAIKLGRTDLLMYAVMRFGKTFTALCCAKEADASLVLVVTAKPQVQDEWRQAVEGHGNFEGYTFATSKNLIKDHNYLHKARERGEKVVLFLSLQDLQGKKMKAQHREVFNMQWDMLIVDETHFGAGAEHYGQVILNKDEKKRQLRGVETLDTVKEAVKKLRVQTTLHLSGTPYRILMGGKFEPEDIIAFVPFTEIAEAKRMWDEENRAKDEAVREDEWMNPYYGFPQMIRFAFTPNRASLDKIKELESHGATASFSELFKPRSLEGNDPKHNTFVHEEVVLDFLKVIDGRKDDCNVLGFLDNERIKAGKLCRHIVMVLPYCASCDAMEKLINEHREEFRNLGDYEILNISSAETEKRSSKVEDIKHKISALEKEGRKTLTLTVNRMLTGVTVPEWDTMLYLKQTASPEEYDQAIFRLQNPYVEKFTNADGKEIRLDKKPQTILVDFDPDRMFHMQEAKSLIYNVNTESRGNTQLKERIAAELSISPVITLDHNKLREVSAGDILDRVMDYASARSVVDEASELPADLSLLDVAELGKIISSLNPVKSKKGILAKAHKDEKGGTGDDTDPQEMDGDNRQESATAGRDGAGGTDANQLNAEKIAAYYSLLLFFAFLTDETVTCLEDIIKVMDTTEDNRRICAALALDRKTLRLLQSHLNPLILNKLDYTIHKTNKLGNDPAKSPQERAEKALAKFGRMSESEVVTPQYIAREMVSALPADLFERGPVLDIASKQGEFAVALKSRYGQAASGKVYSVCTSPLALEFTRKVYKLLGEPTENIFETFTSYDIIDPDKKDNILSTLKEMKFAATIGNPPYHENDGSGASSDAANPIYQKFLHSGEEIKTPLLSLIMPSKWMVGGKVVLKSLRREMMEDKHLLSMVDYEDAHHCFEAQNIDGGICHFLRDVSHEGLVDHTFVALSGQRIRSRRRLADGGFDIVIRDIRRQAVLSKVCKSKKRFQDIVSLTRPFGIRKDLFNHPDRYPDSQLSTIPFEGSLKIYGVKGIKGGSRRREGFISRHIVTKGLEAIPKYKLFFTTTFSTNAINPPEAIVGNPGEICTETFLTVGPFETQAEQLNCLKFFDTHFFKVLLYFGRGTMQVSKGVFRFVPMQDFTAESDIDWSASVEEIDRRLYAKYGLTEEIDFIESMIKEME